MILISPQTVCVLKISNLNLSREMSLFLSMASHSIRYPQIHQISLHLVMYHSIKMLPLFALLFTLLINSQSNTLIYDYQFFPQIANRQIWGACINRYVEDLCIYLLSLFHTLMPLVDEDIQISRMQIVFQKHLDSQIHQSTIMCITQENLGIHVH